MKLKKTRVTVEPVTTLGDLISLVDQLARIVDNMMPAQEQEETPLKIEITFGGKIKAATVEQLDPQRLGASKCPICGESTPRPDEPCSFECARETVTYAPKEHHA